MQKYNTPAVFKYGDFNNVTQYIGKSEANDSFFINSLFQDADGSCGLLNTGGVCPGGGE